LEIKDVRELEDLIIDTIYLELVRGRLDQKSQVFHVEFAIGRDIGPTDVVTMIQTIQTWMAASNTVVKALDQNIEKAKKAQEEAKKDEEELAKQRNGVLEALKLEHENQPDDPVAIMLGGGRRGPGNPKKGKRMGGGPAAGAYLFGK